MGGVDVPPECMPRIFVVRFVRGAFDDMRSFTSRVEAASYSRGYVSGAGLHGFARAFVLPDEYADLVNYRNDTGVDIRPALAAVNAAIEEPEHG